LYNTQIVSKQFTIHELYANSLYISFILRQERSQNSFYDLCFLCTNCLAFNLAAHKRSGLQFLRTNCLASNQTCDSPEGGLCEKNEPDHAGAACCASSNMAFAIETEPSPPHVGDGLVKGAVKGFHIN
jgi:hypothetical protein